MSVHLIFKTMIANTPISISVIRGMRKVSLSSWVMGSACRIVLLRGVLQSHHKTTKLAAQPRSVPVIGNTSNHTLTMWLGNCN